jgi:uncharacterized protein
MKIRKLGVFFILTIFQFSFCKIKTNLNENSVKSEIEIKDRPSNPKLAVNDFAKIFSDKEVIHLENKLRNYYDSTSNEIVIITLNEIDSLHDISEYGLEYGKKWKIGDAKKNNGVIMLISILPKKIRIEVGKGLEDSLTNEKCYKIISEKMVPMLKVNNKFAAFDNSVNELQKIIGNKYKMD